MSSVCVIRLWPVSKLSRNAFEIHLLLLLQTKRQLNHLPLCDITVVAGTWFILPSAPTRWASSFSPFHTKFSWNL